MITVSLETAKKMKELGWEKETRFYFECSKYPSNGQLLYNNEKRKGDMPAPTAQEILDKLPSKIETYLSLEMGFYDGYTGVGGEKRYYAGYSHHVTGKREQKSMFWDSNLAEALALLRIRCKENGYI